MQTSSRRAIAYPSLDRSDRPDIPAHIKNLIDALEVDTIYAQGTAAYRASRTHLAGTFYYETDTALCWIDDGTNWHQVGMRPQDTSGTGPLASRPGANTVPPGFIYFATDTNQAFRSDGTNWILVSSARPMTLASPAVFNLNNTAAETDLINVTVPANTLGTNGTLRYQFYGWFGRPSLAGEQSWQMRFYWGGSLVTWRDGSTNFACGSNGSNGGSSDGKFTLTLRANGTGVQNGFIASGLPGFGNIPHDYDVQGLGKDTTHDQNFRITCQLLTGDGQRWCNIISHELVAY